MVVHGNATAVIIASDACNTSSGVGPIIGAGLFFVRLLLTAKIFPCQ
jgi:hypothetical protein